MTHDVFADNPSRTEAFLHLRVYVLRLLELCEYADPDGREADLWRDRLTAEWHEATPQEHKYLEAMFSCARSVLTARAWEQLTHAPPTRACEEKSGNPEEAYRWLTHIGWDGRRPGSKTPPGGKKRVDRTIKAIRTLLERVQQPEETD